MEMRPPKLKFQSRNRDAFDFKQNLTRAGALSDQLSFNLVIEMLLISSNMHWKTTITADKVSIS